MSSRPTTSHRLYVAALLLAGLMMREAWCQVNTIAAIPIEGTRAVSPDAVLAKIEPILRVGMPFDPDSPEDQAKLEEARRAVMALNFFERVTHAVERGDDGVTITFSVVEKTRIQRVVFVGNTVFTDDELLDVILSSPGQIIDTRQLRRDIQLIKDHYEANRRGASVLPPVADRQGVVTFVINEWVIEDVLIEGLKKTRESYVRREITIKPGDVFDGDAIMRDARAIQNLNLWSESVQVDYRPGVKDVERGVIIVFVVKEKRTGTATGGFGYSSLDDFVGIVSVSESNFRGRGERVTASIQFGGRQSYEFGFVEPALGNSDTTLELNVFDTERRRQFLPGGSFSTTRREFDERRKGFNVTLGRPLSRRLAVSFRVRSEQIEDPFFQVVRTLTPNAHAVSEAASQATIPGVIGGGRGRRIPPPPGNPDLLPDEAEPGDTVLPVVVAAPLADEDLSSVTLGATLDTRDLIADPRHGGFSSFFVEQAGVFGGDSDFTKLSLDARRYVQVGNSDHVVAVRLLSGTTLGDVPLVESFTVGGAYTLRGYREDRFRGENMAVLSAEYRVPVNKNVTAVGFLDVGDAWGGEFPTQAPGFVIPAEHDEFDPKVGVGVGARLNTPFGTLRLDLGRGDEGSEVHLSFGHTF